MMVNTGYYLNILNYIVVMPVQRNKYYDQFDYSWAITSFEEWNTLESTNEQYPRLKNLREMLVQLLFMSVRDADLSEKWKLWIQCVMNTYSMKHMLSYGYASIAWIRDQSFGKGERQLAYKQLWAFYEALNETYPTEALQLIQFMIVRWTGDVTNRYGSWIDARDMCALIYERTQNRRHPAIVQIIEYMIRVMPSNKTTKWFPREHTSPVYDTFVEEWYRHHGYPVCDLRTLPKSKQTHYRRRVRKEVQQLRTEHADYLKEHPISDKIQVAVPSWYTFPGHIVKKVRHFLLYPHRFSGVNPINQMNEINDQWGELKKINIENHKAYIDVSEHMTEDQLDHAIGLALVYTNHVNSIIVVGDVHEVVNLYGTIYEKIVHLLSVVHRLRGRQCNMYNAIASYTGTSILFSTFQYPLDELKLRSPQPVYDQLVTLTNPEQKFIFWNLSNDSSFPVNSGCAKCLMVSGFSLHELHMPSIVMGVELSQVCMSYSHVLMRLHSYRYLGFVNFAISLF